MASVAAPTDGTLVNPLNLLINFQINVALPLKITDFLLMLYCVQFY
jgi:hypothetical protein